MNYSYKSVVAEAKDVDIKSRTITGYASTFGFKDSDDDVIMKGAFSKSLQERSSVGKNRILHLYQHDPTKVLSRPHVLKEDNVGLYFETTLPETRLANDVLKLYEAGIIDEHSIGFQTIRREQKSGFSEIHELKLWEFSSVSWGANEQSVFTGFKSMNPKDYEAKSKAVMVMLKNSDMSDEGLMCLEIYLKQLQATILELSTPLEQHLDTPAPSKVDTQEEKANEDKQILELFNEFKNKFN